jgi:hypothetical protein
LVNLMPVGALRINSARQSLLSPKEIAPGLRPSQ